MIRSVKISSPNRRVRTVEFSRFCAALVLSLTSGLILIFGLTGCGGADPIHVELQAGGSRERDPRRLIIRAEVTGAQDQLSYRWFSKNGECIPQRTDSPATVFCFAEGSVNDRVAVEVWRGASVVAHSELEVRPADDLPVAETRRRAAIHLEITDKPPYDPVGGPNTRAHIGGILTDDLDSALVVIIYARANGIWFVQPSPMSAKHLLRSDHSFSTWTHTGSEYAVLVARPTFTPLAAAEFLPLVETDILAHVIFEGERR